MDLAAQYHTRTKLPVTGYTDSVFADVNGGAPEHHRGLFWHFTFRAYNCSNLHNPRESRSFSLLFSDLQVDWWTQVFSILVSVRGKVNRSNGLVAQGPENYCSPSLSVCEGFPYNGRTGGNSHLDHDHAEKGLHRMRADFHSCGDFFGSLAHEEML